MCLYSNDRLSCGLLSFHYFFILTSSLSFVRVVVYFKYGYRHLAKFLLFDIKKMKQKIFGILSIVCVFGLGQKALAFNPQDVDQLKASNTCPRCELSGADLTQQDFNGANLRDANLMGANLSGTNLRGADLTGAILDGAILDGANLGSASLTGAVLKSASLQNTDLSFAGLLGANLEAANFKGANFLLTNFRGAHFRLTTMPTGLVTSDKPYKWALQEELDPSEKPEKSETKKQKKTK